MIAGECPPNEPDNFYWLLTRELTGARRLIIAGSSCNRTGAPTYSVRQHARAEAEIGRHIDVFVRPSTPIPPQRPWDSPVSCTAFDLTHSPAGLIRHGSVHPRVFRRALGEYTIIDKVERIPGRQQLIAGLVERLFG